MPTNIKFCGLTRLKDAEHAVALGVHAVGFVLVPSSARFITPELAAIIRRRLPAGIQAVALLRNPTVDEVKEALDTMQPDILQFHGEESPEFCAQQGARYWRAVPMGQPQDLSVWERQFPGAEALLLDAHSPGANGGTGRRFEWSVVPAINKPLVLAGGLTADNVAEAIRMVRPEWVDVSSGIESAPGIKSAELMDRFVAQVRRADGH